MKIIKNILLPIEFTNYSIDLLEYVILFARSVRARLHLLHVITSEVSTSFDELNEFFYTIRTNPESEITRSALDQVDLVKVHTRNKTVWEGICRYARESEIDMIMIAAHSHPAEPESPLGETVLRLLTNSFWPVMVIRLPEEGSRHRSSFELTLQEIKREIATHHSE